MSEDTECPTCGRDDFKNGLGMRRHHVTAHGTSISKVVKTCERCGNEYEVIQSRAEESRFCSSECTRNRTTLICERCGDEYEVIQSRAEESRFCSNECTQTRETLVCKHCGDGYEVPQSKAEGSRFCSRECHGHHRGNSRPTNRATLTCEHCGDEYEVPQSKAEGSRFCSRECLDASMRGKERKKWATLTCEQCGCKYKMIQSQAEESRFCSRECMDRWRSERTGEEHPLWKGGRFPYGEGWTEAKKRRVRIRDQARCQDCGMTMPEHLDKYGRDLSVHHIQPARTLDDPENRNAADNLVTLCTSCHKEWEQMAPLRPLTAD